MHLKSIGVENYKCFLSRQTVQVGDGFNLFIGENNSGKTTILEILDLTPSKNLPHCSIKNLLNYGAKPDGMSQYGVTIATNIQEMHQLLGNDFFIPMPTDADKFIKSSGLTQPNVTAINQLMAKPDISITLNLGGGESIIIENCFGASEPAYTSRPNDSQFGVSLKYKEWSDQSPNGSLVNFSGFANQIGRIRENYLRYIYRFNAQRTPLGECSNTGIHKLDPNALNLPYCINHLQSHDAHGHRILCEWVNRVFPSVLWIQAPPLSNSGNVQLQCLPLAPDRRRDDLAVPLSRMGSGIGNVIAILYVVLTSREPQVIAIDEPNSFLHPRALRELLQILATEGKQHQYILTAHSADVITAVNPSLITLFKFDGASTTIQQVSGKDISLLRVGLSDLGIRMTDLHGRDRVLWVEGQTEEIVMPELLRHFCPEIAAGTAVLRVEHTGTFEKKGVDPKEVASLYRRLTESSGLVPPMVAILLDSEKRGAQECLRLEQESNGVLRFLTRTMLENYFLIPDAITAVLNELGEQVEFEIVAAALSKAIGSSDIVALDGAKILKSIFSELSEARHEFTKTRDVPQLTTWLLTNKPEALEDLRVFLRSLVGLP